MSDIDIKVKDYPTLVRRRGAIVNKDTQGYQTFIEARRAVQKRDDDLSHSNNRITALEARLEALIKLVEDKK